MEVVVEDVLGVPCEVFAHRPRSMGDVLARTADSTPDQEYLVFPEQTVSFADVRASAARVAARLSEEYGVSHGDRVGFAAANSLPWAVGWWAVASVGAVISGLNGWWTGAELAYGVELTDLAARRMTDDMIGGFKGAENCLCQLQSGKLCAEPSVTWPPLLAGAPGVAGCC